MGIAVLVVGVVIAALYFLLPGKAIAEAFVPKSDWPSGDKIWDICQAIAKAEGFGLPGAAPTRNHNPGDISDGANTYGFDSAVSDSKVTSFPDDTTGWQWLYNKVSNIVNGKSTVYGQDWSIEQIAQTWAGDSENWASNVASALGVDSSTSFSDYANGV